MRFNKIHKGELFRKLIHYCNMILSLIYYYFLTKESAIILLTILCIIAVSIEYLRIKFQETQKKYVEYFGWMTNKDELDGKITGATYLLFGSLICIILFPREIAVISILYVSVGDPTAFLIGKSIGKIKISGKKTIEGTLAFITSGFFVSLLIPGILIQYKLIASIVAGITEVVPIKINDNLLIPILSGFVLFFLVG